ncbi:ATP-binding protein [Butyrivibrio sp. INlla16]|uniref:ATP-binding protein n=1 Tax=Butyrivibrio sp. INlla16 TaxID=1520807 RepID=UPI0008910C54|nr:ATP-binding protein [Butyrivibrio sp. INlla16]SDB28218.1 IstB-like ATP binding protein [Butyrivibrio sp. INlla16]
MISELQERTSIIITTNKGFEEWTEFLGDAALATAILDRFSYQCDKIPMNGKSYRLENRKSFLNENGKDRAVAQAAAPYLIRSVSFLL